MLIGEYKPNSTQRIRAWRRSLVFRTCPLSSLRALYLPFSIIPFLVGSITKGLIQNVHSETSTFAHIFGLFAYEFRSETETYSRPFVSIQNSPPWLWFTLSCQVIQAGVLADVGREQPALDVQHPIICSRMRSFTQRRWSMWNACKRRVLVVLLKSVRYRTRFYAPSACLAVGVGWFIFPPYELLHISVFIYVCVCRCAPVTGH